MAIAAKQIARLPPTLRAKFASVSARQEVRQPPPRFAHLWGWFLELSESRSEGMGGPAPITYLDILAWVMLTGASPRPVECRLLITIDGAWRAEWHRLQALKNPPAAP